MYTHQPESYCGPRQSPQYADVDVNFTLSFFHFPHHNEKTERNQFAFIFACSLLYGWENQ